MSNWLPKDLKKMREMLAWPDDVLGKYLLGAYIETTAERCGATKASQIKAIGNAIRFNYIGNLFARSDTL